MMGKPASGSGRLYYVGFSLEERITVTSLLERIFHVLQLMVGQVWHDFYQATSEHLYLVADLESTGGIEGELTEQRSRAHR